MTDSMDIYSIKVTLNKCGIGGYTNIFGRGPIIKSVLFPRVRIKYRNADEVEYNGISKTYDLETTYLTEKNWEGASCGESYFLIGNTSSYLLFDKTGVFIKRMYVKEVGTLVSVEAKYFATQTSTGIERLWWADGSLKEENTLSPDKMLKLKKRSILHKGEFIAKINKT